MTGFLLDTNCISEVLRPRPESRVIAWLDAADETSLFLSVLTLGEVRKGILNMGKNAKRSRIEAWLDADLKARFHNRVLPVDGDVADRWGHLTAEANRKGKTLPVLHGLIAATALHHGLTVVSRNERDFEAARVPVLNPWRS